MRVNIHGYTWLDVWSENSVGWWDTQTLTQTPEGCAAPRQIVLPVCTPLVHPHCQCTIPTPPLPVNNTLRLQLCSFPSCLELGSQALYKRAKLQNCTLLHLIKSTLHMCRRSPGILNCCCGLNSLCDRIVVKVELLKLFAALSLSFIFNIQPCLIFSQLQLISSRHRVRESYGRFD